MAKQIEGVLEEVVECAKKEFLEKGYTAASLRTIAAAAHTSTGSIYTRFGDKEGLFRAIVKPVADEMMQIFTKMQEDFHNIDAKDQLEEMDSYSMDGIMKMIDYMYAHFDEFKLLLDASHGTLYQNFVDDLVDIEVRYTYIYIQTVGIRITRDEKMTEGFIHMVVTAYVNGVFEVIRHGMDIDTAKEYINMLFGYNQAGFNTLLSGGESGKEA
ncbi:MAG: TetR/AcrR family transcriptional regulator [Anaerostipes sp.]|nr:TetR/AcrR family transcriptional regulator [Anaerostipes sp.]